MNMKLRPDRKLLLISLMLLSAGIAGCGEMQPRATDSGAPVVIANPISCAELGALIVSPKSISLPTTGAVIASATTIPAAGSGAIALGEYCKIIGAIKPVDPAAPQIKFQLNLPTVWNKKAMMFGGGGYNGSIATGLSNVPAGPVDKLLPLGRGYATYGSDSGHQANANGSRDGTFGANDEALKNFSSDALKKTHDVATYLIQQRYGVAPSKTYFAGGSTGGREALIALTNWPQDFDGAIVLYPAWNAASLDLQFGRITRELAKPGAYSNRAKRKVLYDAAMAACDNLDGVADGLISNIAACNVTFNPAVVRCAGGADTGDTCLSDAQIAAFNVVNTPLTLNYTLATGEIQYPGFNTWGTDFGIPNKSPLQPTVLTLAYGTEQPANPMPLVTASTSPPYGSTFWDQWVKYFVTRDASFNSLLFDPQNPGTFKSRVIALTAIQDVTKFDLSAFKAKGGKILMAHGMADALVSTRATEQYYERVKQVMGTAKVDSFMRYYEIPGYGHAVSSVFNASWDSLTTLENWVENNTPPAPQIVADSAGAPGRTRPLCEYPSWPKYTGQGDVNLAASYACSVK